MRKEKGQSKLNKIKNFVKNQQAGCSMAPLDNSPSQDDADGDDDEDEAEEDMTNLDDDSHLMCSACIFCHF